MVTRTYGSRTTSVLVPLDENYEVLDLISRSPGSTVHRGRRRADNAEVVLKILSDGEADSATVAAFRLEFEFLGRIKSRHVVNPVEFISLGSNLAIVMEHVGGSSLAATPISDLSLTERLTVGRDLALALRGVHRAGLIHSDVSPSNVMLDRESGRAVLIDFGSARELSGSRTTATGATPAYAAPEQSGRMNRLVDHRADLYSLGAVLYEALVGRPPFPALGPQELTYAHLARIPVEPRVLDRGIPLPVSAIVMKLLRKMAEDRYQTATAVARDLDRCLDDLADGAVIQPFEPGENDIPERLSLSQKLYARDAQLEAIGQGFERAASGEAVTILVTGDAGSGKSALVREVNRLVVAQRGYFISGSFERNAQGQPRSGVAEAFRSLIRQILTEPPARVAFWRDRIAAAVGPDIDLMVGFIPELRHLLESELASITPTGGPSEARFSRAFRRFVGSITSANGGTTLTVFLDDLQWADEATLGIIGERASDSAIKYMLLVAAFRSDEVTPNHPLPAMLANIQTTGHEVSELVLPPLTESDVCEFIQDSIGSPAPELAKVINQKTLGNPYYVHRFLEETARRDLLRFDPDVGEWRWDLPAIAALESTGNVVDLIRGRLQELPQTTQHALGIAAVVGRTFRIDTVLVATGESLHAQSALLKVLLPAVDSGVIEPVEGAFAAARSVLGETTGKKFCVASLTLAFVHQQVQDAAELLLDKTTKLRAHQRFGRHLLERADGPDSTFRALNHLNSAAAVATDESDRLELVRANIKGAAYAQSSGAYESALAYYSSARTHLPDDAWLIHRHLAFDAGVGQLESLASTGGFEAAEASYGALKKHARGRAERSRLELAMLDLRTRQANYKQAVAHAVSALSAFDVDIPTDAAEVEAAISAAQYRIERRSAGRPAPFVLEMPELDDPEQHRIQEILAAGAIAGFFVEERVGTYMQWLIVDISLEYGISEFTSFGLTRFVGEACDSDGSWTDVTLALVDRFDSIEVSTRVWTFVASRGSRRIGLTGSLELANRALESSLSIGDDKSASLNAIVSVWLHTILGHPIAEVRAALSVAINQAERARFEDFIVDADLYTRCLNTFTGDTPDLSGPANPRPGGGAGRRSRRHADMKARCDNLMGDHANTWRLSNALFEIMESRAMSTFGFLELRLECALAGASVARETGDLTEEHLTALREAKEVLTPWAKDDPDHFGPRLWMVDAELLAIEERYGEAIKCLDQAIDGFSAAGSVRYAAIAFERTSSLLLSIGATRMASVYLHEARRLFARYGARQKVADITAESSALLARYIPGGTQTSSQTQTPQNAVDLDTEAVLQAVQTLSSEVHLDRLLDSLLALLQQNTGADRVALFAPNEDGLWLLAGERTSTGAQSGPTTAVPLDEYTAGAQSVLHYVQRTREVVRIGAAGDDERFARDPYLQDGDVQSVLCVPSVHQGSVVALLYLESRLRRDVFHSGRVALVETLAAQAAIAMRNAGLVARLEDALGSLKDKNESLADYNRALEEDAAVELHGGRAVGESPIYRAMLAKVETAQATETPILLQGEAGTGKEILARLIHSRSSRREGRFVRISCRSLEATPETWARVSMALDGTLYLDDVSSLPAPFQHELLELMKRDDRPRVIASAGTRLRTQVQAKRISETLYYAVSVFPIDVPPLRDRPTDIPLLVDEFLDVLSLKLGRTFVGVTPESADRMRRYHWPGNAQELLNVMERAALVAESDRLEIDDLLSNAVESGAQLGSYQLVERIGAGGMGEVWRARHKLLRRPAAIKLIPWENFGHAEDSEDGAILRKRFEREAQVTAALQSPNTVQLFDYGTSDTGTFYYVMELLVGLDLESAIKSHGPMPVERVIHVLLQACRSLAEAHSNGLVHRDIKAANVYLCRLGLEVDLEKVLDFGLVRRLDGGSEDETRLTSQGSVGGTPAYMAPEVVLGEDTADHRVDIYALGCLAFWLLTGQLVFDAPTPVKMMFMHVKEPPIPPSELTELDVPEALDDLILSMLAKRPEDRPASADAVMAALAEIDTEFQWTRARAQSWWEVHRL